MMKKLLLFGYISLSCLMASLTSSCRDKSGSEEVLTESSCSFLEPCIQWGCDKETVMNHMAGYKLLYDRDNTLLFEGQGLETSYLYAFATSNKGLDYVVLTFDLSAQNQVLAYLDRNYQMETSAPGHPIYIDRTNTTYVFPTVGETLNLTYMAASYVTY